MNLSCLEGDKGGNSANNSLSNRLRPSASSWRRASRLAWGRSPEDGPKQTRRYVYELADTKRTTLPLKPLTGVTLCHETMYEGTSSGRSFDPRRAFPASEALRAKPRCQVATTQLKTDFPEHRGDGQYPALTGCASNTSITERSLRRVTAAC